MSTTNFSDVPQTEFSPRRSTADELETVRAIVAMLKKNPKKLRAVTVKAGICTPDGQLTEAYSDK